MENKNITEKKFISTPTGLGSEAVSDILSNRKQANFAEYYPKRKQKISHGMKVSTYILDDMLDVSIEKPKSIVELKISNISFFSSGNKFIENEEVVFSTTGDKAIEKLFVFLMYQVSQQAYNNGVIYSRYIEFPLSELIDYRIFTDIHNARKGFNLCMDRLRGISISGELNQGKRKYTSLGSSLFIQNVIKNNRCYVKINDDNAAWNLMLGYYCSIPTYAFSLPERAFSLIYYASYLARQNSRTLLNTGHFTVSLQAVSLRLGLPDINDPVVKNYPKRYIMEPILNAIDDVVSRKSQELNSRNFDLRIVTKEGRKVTREESENMNVKPWLSDLLLDVYMRGAYTQALVCFESKKEMKIMKADQLREKRIQAVMEKAGNDFIESLNR